MPQLPDFFSFSPAVARARKLNTPLVALETTVVTHGLPYPENIHLASEMESVVRKTGATPATVGVLEGKICIGMTSEQLEKLASADPLHKISRRDFAPVLTRGESGGTTVAGTLIAAGAAGLQVFATGGIGGVHRNAPFDISADLPELARTPLIVVCAGAKAILDLPATLEYLETIGVPVLGYRTEVFPAFYSRDSGLPVSARVDSPAEVAAVARTHWNLGLRSAILVVAPPPEEVAIPMEEVMEAIDQALSTAQEKGIRGQAVTPFLLARVSQLTGQASLRANLGLLLNNARLAAQIAVAMTRHNGQSHQLA